MKLVKERKLLVVSGLLLFTLLLIVSVRHVMTDVFAGETDYSIHVLEITESGASDLKAIASLGSGVELETLSMKQFNAGRENLDGKYDAIYIGQGLYNKAGVQNPTGSTQGVLNDLTTMKADEIVQSYINKGLYVFTNKDPFLKQSPDQQGVLYNTFNPYLSAAKRRNVIFIASNEIPALAEGLSLDNSRYASGLKQRPRLTITNRPDIKDYAPSSHVYLSGDTLTFNLNIANVENIGAAPVLAKLYLQQGSFSDFSEEQVFSTKTISTSDSQFSFELPSLYSGVLNWKLEIISSAGGRQLKDYESGAIRYRNTRAVIHVLQVGTDTAAGSNLLNADDYQIISDSMSVTDFNKYINNHSTAQPTYGLNGTYDVLAVNYADTHQTDSSLNALSKQAIQQFAQVNRHGMVYLMGANNSIGSWSREEIVQSGQQEPELSVAPGAANQAAELIAVNRGLPAQFPIYIGAVNAETGALSTANGLTLSGKRNTAFTLNLADPGITPLYNVAGSTQDKYDSYNHYLAYSKGNAFYLGSSQLFTSAETWNKLFVNAIYNTFISSNHSPAITVDSPSGGFPANQKEFILSYAVDDPDEHDQALKTSVKFKANGSYVSAVALEETAVVNGGSIVQSFANPLPSGGTLQAEITAWDSQGAATVRTVNLEIAPATSTVANLDIRKQIVSGLANGKIGINEAFQLEYTITPVAIPVSNVSASDRSLAALTVSDVQFADILPANIEVSGSLPSGFSQTGNAASGITVSKNLGTIKYALDAGKQNFIAESPKSITFTLNLRAVAAGKYALGGATLNYEDLHGDVFDPTASSTGSALGLAGDYNIFTLKDMDISNGNLNVDGSMAAGGDFRSGNLYGGEYFKTAPGTLIVGNDFYYSSSGSDVGVNIKGNVIYGGRFINTVKLPQNSISVWPPTQGKPINFDTTGSYLKNLSAHLASLPATEVKPLYNQFTFAATRDDYNVFTIKAEDIQPGGFIFTNFKSSAVAIINIVGKQVTLNNIWYNLGSLTSSQIIYNFVNAEQVTTVGTYYGNFLAPSANMTSSSTNITGSIIAKSFLVPLEPNGSMNAHLGTLKGDIPKPPYSTALPRVTQAFPSMTLEAVTRVSGINAGDDITIYVGETRKLTAELTPASADNKQVIWASSQEDTVAVDRSSGVIQGLQVGEAIINVTAADPVRDTPPSDSLKVTVIERPVIEEPGIEEPVETTLTINGDNAALVRKSVDLTAVFTPADESVTYKWGESEYLTETTGNLNTFTADKSGTYTVTVSVYDKNGQFLKDTTKTITVTNPATSIEIKGPSEVFTGGAGITLTLEIKPAGADALTVDPWTLSPADAATLVKVSDTEYRLRANGGDSTSVTVNATAGSLSDEHVIAIIQLLSLSFNPNTLTIPVGSEVSLLAMLHPYPASISVNDIAGGLIWTQDNKGILKLEQNGDIVGLAAGQSAVTVQYILSKDKVITATIPVTVTERTGDRF